MTVENPIVSIGDMILSRSQKVTDVHFSQTASLDHGLIFVPFRFPGIYALSVASIMGERLGGVDNGAQLVIGRHLHLLVGQLQEMRPSVWELGFQTVSLIGFGVAGS